MRRYFCGVLCLLSLGCLLLTLCGCGATQSALLGDATTSFAGQHAVVCSISYAASFDAVIDGEAYTCLEHSCLVEVSLLIYQDTGLPACVRLDYSNLSELEITFSDVQGNQFTLTSLSYQVCYETYGAQVAVEVPEDFRQQALTGSLGLADSFSGVTDGGEPEQDASNAASPPQQDSDTSELGDPYTLTDDTGTYRYEIATPEFMALDQQSDSSVSFYYYYGPEDLELISYTLCQGYTQEDELAYAQSLPDFYRGLEGVSDVSFDGIQSVTLEGWEVWYSTVQLTLEQDGETYEVLDLYSWMEAPNGQDCLEVCITEYNGSGDGEMIDPEAELEYAYGAVQCQAESE